MTESREGRGFVERDLSGGDGDAPKIIFGQDAYQEKRRKENRKMIERGRGIDMNDLTAVSSTINVQGRRTRGKGRKINYSKP